MSLLHRLKRIFTHRRDRKAQIAELEKETRLLKGARANARRKSTPPVIIFIRV